MIKGFIFGLVTANAFEWVAHKYLLHGVARQGQPRFSLSPASMDSHWAHHRMVRKTVFADECYEQGLSHGRTRLELASLALVAGAMTVFWPVSRGFVLATTYSAGHYFYVHRRAHLDPKWAKKRIPWHYDHHMNTIQDANWCVTRPWFDYVMGTREASTAALMESNPSGFWLPQSLERPLNRVVRRLLPHAYARIEAKDRETLDQARVDAMSIPDSAVLT